MEERRSLRCARIGQLGRWLPKQALLLPKGTASPFDTSILICKPFCPLRKHGCQGESVLPPAAPPGTPQCAFMELYVASKLIAGRRAPRNAG